MSQPRTQIERIVFATLFAHPTTRLKDEAAFRQFAESAEVTLLAQEFKQNLCNMMEQWQTMSQQASVAAEGEPNIPDESPATPAEAETEGSSPTEDLPEAAEEAPSAPLRKDSDSSKTTLQPGEIPTHSAPPIPPVEPAIRTFKLSIPNGLSGQRYVADLLTFCPELQEYTEILLKDGANTGLTLESPARLTGTLGAAGSYQLRVNAQNADFPEVLELNLKIAVIPNSRHLWKTLPADQNAPYAKPESDVQRIAAQPGWQLTMASQRGRSHAHKGTHRDDHGVVMHTENDWNLLVVADGAGSCLYSREGSRLATKHASQTLQRQLSHEGDALKTALTTWWRESDRSTLPQSVIGPLSQTIIPAVHDAYTSITQEAERSGYATKDFSTTLLLAVHTPTDNGHLVVSFSIGDGAIALLNDNDTVKLMNVADSGEHAGQTRFLDKALFLDARDLYQRIQIQMTTSFEALLVATDGVTDPKFSSDSDMHNANAWWNLFGELKPVLPNPTQENGQDALLDYLDFFIERHHDDRTVAVLHRTTGDAPLSESAEPGESSDE